jgi:CBS domain-containing protein
MRAGALMTSDPRSCQPEDDLHCAVRIMKIENCGIVPVTKGNGGTQVVGVVTDRDIALYLGTTDARASTAKVKDVMSTSLVFCAPDTDSQEVSRRMQDAQVRRLLVLEGRRLVGVISTADLARSTGYGLGIGEEVKQIVVEVSRPTAW